MFNNNPYVLVNDLICDKRRIADLTPSDIKEVRNVSHLDSECGNTCADIITDLGERTTIYDRIDLGSFFSLVGLRVKERVYNSLPRMLKYIKEQYGVDLSLGIESVTKDGHIYLYATHANPSWTGEVKVECYPIELNEIDIAKLYEYEFYKLNGTWLITPKVTHQVDSFILTSDINYNPNDSLVGVWEQVTPLELTADEYDFYRSPRGSFFEMFLDTNDFKHVTLVCLDNNEHADKFNDGIAKRYDFTGGESEGYVEESGWQIIGASGRELVMPFSTKTKPMEGVNTYFLVDKASGHPYTTDDPEFKWKRVK